MRSIVIGIHGLGNKPDRRLLKRWWQAALHEGLCHSPAGNIRFRFEMVYWAHLLHPEPLDPSIRDSRHRLFLHEPYFPVSGECCREAPGAIRKGLHYVLERLVDGVLSLRRKPGQLLDLEKYVLEQRFRDLNIYFFGKCERNGKVHPARQVIRNGLISMLHRHRRKRILLIAHSMGSIIAYDVLQNSEEKVNVDSLVTIGSPLGLPTVTEFLRYSKATGEGETPLVTPEAVHEAWYNLSDIADSVALNYELAASYPPNSRGVSPQDSLVNNDYQVGKERNPHKSYGYLRCGEMSRILHQFLAAE